MKHLLTAIFMGTSLIIASASAMDKDDWGHKGYLLATVADDNLNIVNAPKAWAHLSKTEQRLRLGAPLTKLTYEGEREHPTSVTVDCAELNLGQQGGSRLRTLLTHGATFAAGAALCLLITKNMKSPE
ncbi:MAG: hypothetical protein AB7F19_02710 [Candidatus Babeliales bacterium]